MKPSDVQPSFNFDPPKPVIEDFGGKTYEPAKDGERLTGHLGRIYDLMLDMRWRTLAEIASLSGGSEAGSSARLRDLRKPQFGSWNIERRRAITNNGIHEYRLNGRSTCT